MLARDNAPESAYLRILTSLFGDFVDEAGKATADRGRTASSTRRVVEACTSSSVMGFWGRSRSWTGTTAASWRQRRSREDVRGARSHQVLRAAQ